jgi:hypothetical protein
MAKKPPNAGILFEREFIKVAQLAGFVTEKLSTPTPPMRPCTCGATPRSSFTTTRPYDVLMTLGSIGRTTVWAVECKSSGKEPRLPLDRIQPHQIKGLQDRAAAGWRAGLAIDLPAPSGNLREWWWLEVRLIEVLLGICGQASRKSATWKELRDAGAVQLGQNPSEFAQRLLDAE